MNVVFIVTSFWSFGELLIAVEFADELIKSGDKICFIAPPTHKNTILKKGYICISLVPKSRQLNRILFNEVKYSFKPDLVILSDFLNYNFADRHYGITKEDLKTFIILLNPVAPHITEELWEILELEGYLHDTTWPVYDEEKTKDKVIALPVQVNGKVRGTIEISIDDSQDVAREKAKADDNISRFLEGKQIVKEIFVAGKIYNIVVK